MCVKHFEGVWWVRKSNKVGRIRRGVWGSRNNRRSQLLDWKSLRGKKKGNETNMRRWEREKSKNNRKDWKEIQWKWAIYKRYMMDVNRDIEWKRKELTRVWSTEVQWHRKRIEAVRGKRGEDNRMAGLFQVYHHRSRAPHCSSNWKCCQSLASPSSPHLSASLPP